jgi:hypothetical protein
MPSFGYMIDGVDYRDPKYGLKSFYWFNALLA